MENSLNIDVMNLLNNESINKKKLASSGDAELFSEIIFQQFEQLEEDTQILLLGSSEIDNKFIEVNEENKLKEEVETISPLLNQDSINPLINVKNENDETDQVNHIEINTSQDVIIDQNLEATSSKNAINLNQIENFTRTEFPPIHYEADFVKESKIDQFPKSSSLDFFTLDTHKNSSFETDTISFNKNDVSVDLKASKENQELFTQEFEIDIEENVIPETEYIEDKHDVNEADQFTKNSEEITNTIQLNNHIFVENSISTLVSQKKQVLSSIDALNQIVSDSEIKHFESNNLPKILTEINQEVQSQSDFEPKILKLTLQPENLGKLEIKLEMKNDKLNAEFLVTNSQVKELLENQLTTLRENFIQQNIQIETMDILIHSSTNSSLGFGGDLSQRQQQQKQAFKSNKLSQQYELNEDYEEDLKTTKKDSIDIYV